VAELPQPLSSLALMTQSPVVEPGFVLLAIVWRPDAAEARLLIRIDHNVAHEEQRGIFVRPLR
jgi:hypothetical protein